MSTQSQFSVSLPGFVELPRSVGSPNDSSPCTLPESYNGLKLVREKRVNAQARGESYRSATISTLPDDVLLEIFDLYQKTQIYRWHLIVHVCRRWRQITFSSPRRLNLQILCRDGSPVRKRLGIWPPIPIVVQYGSFQRGIAPNEEDNVIAALEHPDRVCQVKLRVTGSQFGKMAAVMQGSFPVLTHLSISVAEDVPDISSGFLGGPAPCLQKIELYGIPFPALPTLLLSAIDLVELRLWRIPPTGYISPEAMVAGLAALPMLVHFRLDFQDATPPTDRMHPPPVPRTVLPALTHFTFLGDCEYLEDFVARIDAPQLRCFEIIYWDLVDDLEVPQLCRFINCSENLKRSLSRRCELVLYDRFIDFKTAGTSGHISVRTISKGIDWQISEITYALSLGWISPLLSDTVHFSIVGDILGITIDPEEVIDNILWLQLLRLFPSVQTLFVSREFAGHVSRALEDIAGVTVAEVLPALDLLCLEDHPVSSVDKFITVRRGEGHHPVTIVNSRREFDDRLELYP